MKINLEYDGEKYTLEYTRDTVLKMADRGFDIESLATPIGIASGIPELFHGAFLAHHPYVNRKATEKIYESIKDREHLLATLVEMYRRPIEALLTDPEEPEGNVVWEVQE